MAIGPSISRAGSPLPMAKGNRPKPVTRAVLRVQPLRRSLVVAILGFVAFVTSFGAHVVAVNLPVYARQVGVGLTAIGVIIPVYVCAEMFAKPVF